MPRSRSRLAADWFAKLRLNAQNEVEHEEVVAAEAAAANIDMTSKADVTYVDTAISNIDMSGKADVTYVDTAVANAGGFKSAAAEGNVKNEAGVVYVYASGAWRQIYPAVYS